MIINIDKSSFNSSKFINDISDKLDKACKEAVRETCYKIEADAKMAAPVDTGRLRDSINSVFDFSRGNYVGIVGTDINYAQYVEFGTGIYASGGRSTPWVYRDSEGNYRFTHGMQPRPFLTPAFINNKRFAEKRIESKIRSVFGG